MINKLAVILNGALVGHLAENQGKIAFQYDEKWLRDGFDLSPGSLPFDAKANLAMRPVFDKLHGVFNDSLPDGWGLLLMDRALKKYKGLDKHQVTPLHRLAYMGTRCMGALEYRPEILSAQDDFVVDLSEIARQSEKVLNGETDEVLEALRLSGGSPGGARPKVTVAFDQDFTHCVSGIHDLPTGYSNWIVKFRNDDRNGQGDPADIGKLEMAYAEMAREAGLEVPPTRLLNVKVNRKNESYFSVKRFDRDGSRKIHFLSLAGYAYASHREPCLDYGSGVLAATKKLTRNDQEVAKAFRLMLFNVLAHNKDDHSKNFAYLFDPEEGVWRLSPAFDLTFNHGISNQHTTSINGSGNPGFEDLKKVAKERNVKKWIEILEQVQSAVNRWPEFAEKHGLTKSRVKELDQIFKSISNRCRAGSK